MQYVTNAVDIISATAKAMAILAVAFGIAASAYSLGRSHGWMDAIRDEEEHAEARARIVEQVRAMDNRELLDFGAGKNAGERK